jgi:hypothetical protein
MKVLFLAILVVFFTLSSCSKYKETTKYALLSKNQRIAKDWKLMSQSENLRVKDLTGFEIHLDLHQDNSYVSSTRYLLFGQVVRTEKKGTWHFSTDSKSLLLNETNNQKIDRLTIVLLTKGELQLQQIIPVDQEKKSVVTKLFTFKTK